MYIVIEVNDNELDKYLSIEAKSVLKTIKRFRKYDELINLLGYWFNEYQEDYPTFDELDNFITDDSDYIYRKLDINLRGGTNV